MSFTNALVEMDTGSGWIDITGDVYTRDPIRIEWGRRDEGARVDSSRCHMTINNKDGKYSPQNPLSPYYGIIGRNTPLRASVHAGTPFLSLPGAFGDRASTPDVSALDITGDLDVRIDVTLQDWNPTSPHTALKLAGKYDTAANQRSWRLLAAFQRPVLTWSTTGADFFEVTATEPAPVLPSGRIAIRATLDVNNGADGHTVTFYTAPTISGPWTQLGDPIVGSGTTSVFASTAPLDVGDIRNLVFTPPAGRCHAFELRSGIGGPAVASADFTTQPIGTTTFTDGAGRVWTVAGGAKITNRRTRFVGEVSSWPQRWDVSGNDVYIPVEAFGILRRLGQGSSPLQSVMRRELSNPARTGIVAYWPCEDGAAATQLASALPGAAPMRVTGGVRPAASSPWPASDALPTMGDGTLRGAVPGYTVTGETNLRMFVRLPDNGVSAETRLLTLGCTGSAATWSVWVDASSRLALRAYDADGTQILNSGYIAYTTVTPGGLVSLGLELTQTGPDVDVKLIAIDIDAATLTTSPYSQWTSTLTGRTVGRVQHVTIGQDRGLGDTVIGHIALANEITAYANTHAALAGWSGETARDRIVRLCAEEEIPIVAYRDSQASALVGPQRIATVLELLQDAADADGGVLHEQRDAIGLAYRPMATLYNQSPRLELDYQAPGEVAPPLEPKADDEATRNDVTVERRDGGSARMVLAEGPLSVLPPPAGVGRYDESLTLNLAADDQAEPIAAWRLHLGTWDGPRYPVVHLRLNAAPHLIDTATEVGMRDRVTIAHPPLWLPPGTIDLLTEGGTETIGEYAWDIEYTANPAGPWAVAVTDDSLLSRVDTDGSTLAADIDATTASIQVASAWYEDFEDDDLVVSIAASGNAGWSRSDTSAYSGTWSLRSGAITHSQTSDAVVTVPAGTQTVRFWYRVSCEETFDVFRVLVDGTQVLAGSGEIPWTQSNEIDVRGAATVTFRFGKDDSISAGQDAAWIDALSFTNGPTWTTDAAATPWSIEVGGEAMTVTAVSGTSSPQTFTVIRSVNGISKPHATGTGVRLAQPAITAL